MGESRLSATDARLPEDLRRALEAYAERSDWVGAVRLLLSEGERRSEVRERVACYLTAAAIFEEKFANNAEAQSVLEYVLGLSPDEPEAIQKLGNLYARARRQEKLRWLAEDRSKLAAQARVPKPLGSQVEAPVAGTGGVPGKIGAAIVLVGLPASVVTANMHAVTLVERHDNAGGAMGWLTFVGLDLMFCTLFVAFAWLPGRWAVRRVGQSVLLGMLALLGATFLIGMVPTLGWNTIDAANVLLDPNPPSAVRVRVVAHERRSKSRSEFSVVQELSADGGSTPVMWSLDLEPIGSEHVLRRGEGFFLRAYYLRPRTTNPSAASARSTRAASSSYPIP